MPSDGRALGNSEVFGPITTLHTTNTMNYFETSQPMPYLFELLLASSNCRNRQELDQIVSTMRRIQGMERLYARS